MKIKQFEQMFAERMFAEKRTADEQQTVTATKIEEPDDLTRHPIELRAAEVEPLNYEKYLALAQRAGFASATQIIAEKRAADELAVNASLFRAFLASNGITVYDDEKVTAYLWRIAPANHQPYWSCVNGNRFRQIDKIAGTNMNNIWIRSDQSRQYMKPIPEAVLMTMAKIRDEYKSVSFYVSDFENLAASRRIDPFLAVEAYGEFFIIERWDEPAFRM